MLKRITIILSIMSLVILTGCNQKQSDNTTINKTPIKVDNASWLRDKLPEKTLAYIRVPTIWNVFFEASADSLYPALSHANNKAEVLKLQNALVDTFVSEIPEAYHTHFKLLVKSIDTPLEIAVTNAVDNSMVPNVLIGTTLKDFSKAELQKLIDSVVAESQNAVRLIAPLSDDGKATLMVQMIPMYVNYDINTGKLAILSGPTASDKVLTSLLAQSQAHASLSHIMEFENSVDQSGKNQQAWVNVKAIYQQNQAMIPPPQKAMIEQMGIADMDFIWYGTAHHSGKGELIFHVQMPDTGLRQLLPRVNEEFDIQTAGTPDFAFVLSLPTVEQISQAYEFIKVLNPDLQESDQEIQAGLAKVNEYLGMNLADLLKAYGQQIMIVKDESGLWMAQKIVDQQMSQRNFEMMNEKFAGKTQSKTLSGVSINETSFSMVHLIEDLVPEQPGMDAMNELFYGTQKFYSLEENGYFIWATVPQILADRVNSNNKTSLKTFLENDLHLNWNQAFMAWAVESEYVSRNAYHTYLEIMSFLGNMAKSEVDLFNFPTAQELNLPKKGRFGMSLNSSPDFFSIRVSYEHSVLESLSSSGGMIAVAMVGIVAAYAIPAYRDYTLRVNAGQCLAFMNGAKLAVSERWGATNNLSSINSNEAAFLVEANSITGENVKSVTVSSPGVITCIIGDSDSAISNRTITQTPHESEDSLIWECTTNISNPAHRPGRCIYADDVPQ